MGNNRLPVLSRISPEVRDNDFIPITELKVFDERIDEIVKLFNSIEASGESGNIAQQMKDIEYNMADALIFDTDGNIVGYKTDENNEPIYGENDIKTMLSKLEDYYNQFVMLMGNDPRMDNWKADLNRYYTEAIGELNNKINSIFRNSINMTALEAKEDPKNNYVLDDAKEMTSGSIMRLNPDTSTYIRNINVRISNPGEENVVFDVIEAVKDSLVMNLKLQNGSMYFDFNIVIDKGKIFISNERVLPEEAIQLTNGYIIKIYKFYEEFSDKAHYVFTFSAPVTDIYGFEITGILVSGFDFNNSGLGVTSHSKYYKYVLVENEEPNYNETYYFKETDPSIEDGKISYVPVEKVTSFNPEKEYYRKERQFFKFKEWDVFNYEYDGNITTDGYLKDNEDQVVVEKAKYNKDLKMINVNIENEEIVNKDLIDYKNHIIKNEEMWNPDDSVRIVHRGTESNRFELLGKGAYKPTNKDIMAFGEVIFEKYDLAPGEIVALNDCIAEGYDRQVTHGTSDKVTMTEKTYLKADFTNTENPVKFVSKVIFKGKDISGIVNKYIMDNIAFVGKIKIMMYIGNDNPDMIYFYLLPDDCEFDVTSTEGISDIVFYSFALNLSDKKQSVFTFVRPEIENDILKKLGRDWNDTDTNLYYGSYKCIILANNGRLVAGGYDIKYSDDNGITWNNSNITRDLYWCITLANNGRLVAGSNEKGIKYSDDNGETWKDTNITSDDYYCITVANDGTLLAGSGRHGIKYSINNGITWVDSNITSSQYRCIIKANNGRLVTCGINYGIKYSDNNGITWKDTNITGADYRCIILANDGRLIAGGNSNVVINYGIKYSDNNGETWKDSSITDGNYNCIIVANDGRLIAGDGNGKGIIYSDNNGITWNNTNISSGTYYCIALANNGTLVAGGSSTGIKYSDDNGITWNDSNVTSGGFDCITVANNGILVAGSNSNKGIKYSIPIYSHKPITKLYSLPNESVVRDVNEKFGHNGYTFAEIPNERLIYSTLDKTFIKNPADDDCLFDYQFNKSQNNKVIGTNPIYSKIDPTTGDVVYKNTTFDKRYNVEDINEGANTDIIKSFVTDSIYINKNNTLSYFDDWSSNIENLPDIDHIDLDYGFETDDGVFVVGKVGTKDIVCFAPWPTNNKVLNFSVGFTADYIDYLRSYNNEIIISSYDVEHDGARWKFNRDTLAFEGDELVNGNSIPSFNNVFEIHGSLYIINGTGKRTVNDSYQGLYKLYKSTANNVNNGYFIHDLIEEFSLARVGEKEFYNIPMIKFYENNSEYYLFIYNNIVNKEIRIDFDLYEYADGELSRVNSTTITDSASLANGYSYTAIIFNSPICKKINSILKIEFNKISESIDYEYVNPDYSIVTQALNDSFDNMVINSNNDIVNNPNLLHEKFYFDKENSYVKFETIGVNQEDRRFVLSSEKIAVGTTLMSNKTNIVINLAKDCKVAVFDKACECLKTVSLGYEVNLNGQKTVVKFDPEYFMFDNLIIGSENEKNTIYIVVHGRFPTVTLNNNEFVFDYDVDSVYKLFSIDIDNIIGSNNEMLVATLENNYTFEGTIPTSGSIRNYIKTRKLQMVSRQLELELVDDLQYVDVVNGLRYENTNSIVFWNTVSNSLDFVTKINIRDKYKTVIENNSETIEPVDLILCEGNNLKIEEFKPSKEKENYKTWKNSNITIGNYRCIIVANNDRLVAISGTYNSGDSDNGTGIKYSDDNGITWKDTNITNGSFGCIIVANDGTLVAGSISNSGNNTGIKYSDDNGETWMKSKWFNNNDITSGYYLCMILANDGRLIAGGNGGIIYSDDNGITWNHTSDKYGYCYYIVIANNGRLVACRDRDNGGIKYSDDNGETWNNSNVTSDFYQCITIANDGTLVASGNNGIKYSDDNGITWNDTNISVGGYCITLADNGRLIAGSGVAGIKYSDDNGITWNNTNITSGYYLCMILANDGILVAGGDNTGIKYSDDNGETWKDTNITSGFYLCITLANDGTLVAGSSNGDNSSVSNIGIKYSPYIPAIKINEVKNDIQYGNQLPIPYGKKSIEFIDKSDKEKLRKTCYVKNGLLIDEKFVSEKKEFNDNVIKVGEILVLVAGSDENNSGGSKGIKYSTDNGKTWNNTNINGGVYRCITLANDGGLVAGSGSDYGIKYSTDGIIWNNSNISNGSYYCITLANNGRLVAGSNTGIKYSNDNGKTWIDSNVNRGHYTCITVAKDGTLVAGSFDNGIKYSTDNGITWNNSNETSGGYWCITLAQNGTLVAGSNSDTNIGIKYSDDNGITWNNSNITSDSYFCITLVNNGRLVAGSVGDYFNENDKGIKYSDDNGITWKDSSVTNGRCYCITVANDGTLVAGSNDNGIKYSTDNGKTWNNTNISSGHYSCITVAIDGTLVAGSGYYNNVGIKYSDDNGKTWKDTNISSDKYYCITSNIKKTTKKSLITEASIGSIKYDNILKFVSQNKLVINTNDKPIKFIKDTSEGVLFVVKDLSEDLVYKLKNIPNEKEISINDENYFEIIDRKKEIVDIGVINNELTILNKSFSGKTWNDSNITSGKYFCITVANDGRLLAGSINGDGIKYSDDNGITWNNTNITSVNYKFIILTNNDRLIAVSNYGGGIKYSDDNGKTWNKTSISTGSYYCITLANNGTLVAGSNSDAGIKYSDDNGITWNNTNITSLNYKFIILTNNDRLIAVSNYGGGIKYSDDNGITWNKTNITGGIYNCIGLSNNGVLVVSVNGGKCKYSDNNGITWKDSSGVGFYYCITAANDGRLVAGSGIYIDATFGIKYSDDDGVTWNNTNITSGVYNCIVLVNNDRLIAGSRGNGIKYSDDNGITWNNTNITSGDYYCIALANDGTLVASEFSKGIIYSTDNGETWTDTNITNGDYYCIALANDGTLVAGSGDCSNGIKYCDEIINDKLIFTKSNEFDYKIISKNGDVYNKDNTLLINGKYNLKNINSNIINPNVYSKLFKSHILVGENNILIDFDKNIYLPKSAKAISNSILHTIQINHNHDSSSFDKIAKILFEKGVPLDKTVKVIGSIIYNNIPVSITNLRIASDNSRTKTPLAIYFSIDKEFRLPNDVFINNEDNFTENNSHGEYDQFVKRGIISNYNIDTNERITDINNVITKCNFTIICDNQ